MFLTGSCYLQWPRDIGIYEIRPACMLLWGSCRRAASFWGLRKPAGHVIAVVCANSCRLHDGMCVPGCLGHWRLARSGVGFSFMELGRKFGRNAWHAVSCLLLLLVAFHASVPAASPLERVRGSAFSAATADVSVLRGRPVAHAARMVGVFPVPAVAELSSVAALAPAATAAGLRLHWPGIFPPWHAMASSPLAPRAPPVG